MQSSQWYRRSVALGAAALIITGCGDDEPTGPEFGDLVFSPASPVLVSLAREVELELTNVANEARGPLIIGAGNIPLSVPREFTCPGMEVVVTPSQVASISAGGTEDVVLTFSFAGLTEEECPFAMYEVDVNVAQGQTVVASSQLLVDHVQLE